MTSVVWLLCVGCASHVRTKLLLAFFSALLCKAPKEEGCEEVDLVALLWLTLVLCELVLASSSQGSGTSTRRMSARRLRSRWQVELRALDNLPKRLASCTPIAPCCRKRSLAFVTEGEPNPQLNSAKTSSRSKVAEGASSPECCSLPPPSSCGEACNCIPTARPANRLFSATGAAASQIWLKTSLRGNPLAMPSAR